MGMFDSVYVDCPKCGGTIEFQSKAGACILASYTVDSIPLAVAQDLNETSKSCNKCGTVVELTIPYAINDRIPMVIKY